MNPFLYHPQIEELLVEVDLEDLMGLDDFSDDELDDDYGHWGN